MKRHAPKAKKSGPRIKKPNKKEKRKQSQIQYNEQEDDDIVISNSEQYHNVKSLSPKLQIYESPQDVKIRLAKQMITDTKALKRKQMKDDFFLQEDGKSDQQGKRESEFRVEVQNHLKEDYFRARNKLYEQIDQEYVKGQLSEPTVYKGHTKCITGIHLTRSQIYSCSKDRSIIKWDRETMKKEFFSLGKDLSHHQDQILTLSMSQRFNMLATAGEDWMIKLWDVRTSQLIGTLKSHKNTVNGIAFGNGDKGNLCSVGSDRTFKQWDIGQRNIIQTFYGHREEVLDIDNINDVDFLSSGNDRQVVVWKTQRQTQVTFQGHDYAIDRIRCINDQKFITASQDGSVYLWSQRRKKPLYKHQKAHSGWISAMGNIPQSNVFATGANDKFIRLWSIGAQMKFIKMIREVPVQGIITDIKMDREYLAAAQCDQHRLGRWVTTKCRNKIKVYRFKN